MTDELPNLTDDELDVVADLNNRRGGDPRITSMVVEVRALRQANARLKDALAHAMNDNPSRTHWCPPELIDGDVRRVATSLYQGQTCPHCGEVAR